MKSPLIEQADYIDNKEKYSDLQILNSMGGYYVGTLYEEDEGFLVPGSRDSNYFKTRIEAEEFLQKLETGSKDALNKLRDHP